MTLVEDINAQLELANSRLTSVGSKIDTLDTQLDTVLTYIQQLLAQGNGATQEELQQILNSVTLVADTAGTIDTHAEAVVAEAEKLDDPQS